MKNNNNLTIPELPSGRPFQESFFNEELWTFMNNLWEDSADYKVLMARRMLNLNCVLMQEWDVKSNKQYLTDSIMSNTAFLLSARAIADRYAFKKKFPRILICDDIMLHGRGIMALIDRFERIVSRRLKENHIEINEKKLRFDLRNAILIYVFAKNNREGLLIDESSYHLSCARTLPISRLRELSQDISNFLQSREVANTSYVMSIQVPWHQLRVLFEKRSGDILRDPGQRFYYRGREMKAYIRERSRRTIETIRLYYIDENLHNGAVLTSLPIFGDIRGNLFDELCAVVAQHLEQYVRYSQISTYLLQKDEELIKPRAQLLSFLYSILSMADFCQQNLHLDGNELYRVLVSGDFNKIISNFDDGDIVRYEILNLFRELCIHSSESRILWDHLDRVADEVNPNLKSDLAGNRTAIFAPLESPEPAQRKKKYEDAEDIFYEVGMDAEYDAFRYIQMNIPFDPSRSGVDTISLSKYLHIMKGNRGRQSHSLGCMFGLMDSGLVSMNLEVFRSSDGQRIRTVLKAGELATYVLPRRFSVFIPALAYVESQYAKVGKYLRDVIGFFVDYLQGHCYERYGVAETRDENLLRDLENRKSLLLYVYSAGQKFQDWNIELRNERKYMLSRLETEEEELSYDEERARKSHYLLFAREFIKQYCVKGNP